MPDQEISDDENPDEFKKSIEASETAIRSGGVAFWNFIKGAWRWIDRRHPFIQLLFTLPTGYALKAAFTPFAAWFYAIFWENQVIISGSLYVSGLPIPLSWMIYVLVLLLTLTMISNYRNQKQIQELQKRLSD